MPSKSHRAHTIEPVPAGCSATPRAAPPRPPSPRRGRRPSTDAVTTGWMPRAPPRWPEHQPPSPVNRYDVLAGGATSSSTQRTIAQRLVDAVGDANRLRHTRILLRGEERPDELGVAVGVVLDPPEAVRVVGRVTQVAADLPVVGGGADGPHERVARAVDVDHLSRRTVRCDQRLVRRHRMLREHRDAVDGPRGCRRTRARARSPVTGSSIVHPRDRSGNGARSTATNRWLSICNSSPGSTSANSSGVSSPVTVMAAPYTVDVEGRPFACPTKVSVRAEELRVVVEVVSPVRRRSCDRASRGQLELGHQVVRAHLAQPDDPTYVPSSTRARHALGVVVTEVAGVDQNCS